MEVVGGSGRGRWKAAGGTGHARVLPCVMVLAAAMGSIGS